jgi:hypothetical protein
MMPVEVRTEDKLRRGRFAFRLIAAAASIAVAVASMPQALAQDPPPRSSLVPPASAVPMTLAEYQALSCAAVGTVVGLGALTYLDPVALAASGIEAGLLAFPVAAATFAVACSVGATLAPAFLWAYRRHQ